MADTLRDLAYGASLRSELPQQPPPLRDTLASLLARQDTIGTPYRSPLAQLVGNAGSVTQRLADALDQFKTQAQARISLKDLTVGDAGRVLEDWSYGMPPTTGGNYATGGIGTIGMQPRAMDLFNLGGVAGGAVQAGKVGARVLGPTLREMARKGIEGNMRATGGIQDLITWHGSPHTFDKFDASKIGTGEGAQAYGHGLYLAESPEVAKSYQKTLSSENGFLLDGQKLSRKEVQDILDSETGGYLDGITRPSGVADYLMDALSNSSFGKPKRYAAGSERSAYYDALQKRLSKEDAGSLYKVDLPDSMIERMLDWDKPLSAQPMASQDAVAAMLEKQAAAAEAQRLALNAQYPRRLTHPVLSKIANKQKNAFDYKGEAAVSTLVQQLGGPVKAAEYLRAQGIPGIRYLDGGSRADGLGTSNFVVFPGEESALTILERNGRPLR